MHKKGVKGKLVRIKHPIYKQDIILVLGLTIDEFKEKYKVEIDKGVRACYLPDWKWLVIPPKTETSTIIHECFHIVYDLLRYSGVRLSEDSEEVFCYELEWWFNKITKIINAKKL